MRIAISTPWRNAGPFGFLATLRLAGRGLARVLCDGKGHFVFEVRLDGEPTKRTYSSDPRRFHDFVRSLTTRGWCFEWAPVEPGCEPSEPE